MKITLFITPLVAALVVVGQRIRVQPLNTAAKIGSKTFFNCTVSRRKGTWIYWGYTTSIHDHIGKHIYSSQQGNRTFIKEFGVEADATRGSYNVIVKEVTPKLVGWYWFFVFPEADLKSDVARLIAVDAISCPTPGEQTRAGDLHRLVCRVTFHGYRYPNLTWVDAYGNQISSRTIVESSNVSSVAELTLSAKYDDLRLTCFLEFLDGSAAGKGYSPNVPVYRDECSTFVYVMHPVTTIRFEPPAPNGTLLFTLWPGRTIKCSANGRPTPSYTWRDPFGKETAGQAFAITDEMTSWNQPINCTCIASNVALGHRQTTERSVNFRVGQKV